MELIAKVLSGNGDINLVFDEMANIKYTKYEDVFIIGRGDNDLRVYYKYDRPTKGFEAFAGHQFDIPLTDGTIEKAYGQWWDGVIPSIMEKVDIPFEDVVRIGYNSIEQLMSCYVMFSIYIKKSTLKELMKKDVPVYDHRDYDWNILQAERARRGDIYKRMIKDKIIQNGFREKKKGVYENRSGLKLRITDITHYSLRSNIPNFSDLEAPDEIKDVLKNIFNDTFEYITDLGPGKICIRNYTKNKRWEFLPIIATWEQK